MELTIKVTNVWNVSGYAVREILLIIYDQEIFFNVLSDGFTTYKPHF